MLSDGIKADIPENSVKIVFALDMFHMVKNPDHFLREISRIIRADGILFIEDGHQPRKTSRDKIMKSGFWKIKEEEKRFLKCIPVK